MDVELRKLQDSDKEVYIELANEIWVNKKILQDEVHNNRFWEDMFSDTEIHYAILMGNQICGFASIMKLDKEVQELGLELFERYHHQGIGYATFVQLLKICKDEYHMKKIQTKIYADNFPSILLMRKIGGIPFGITRNVCIDETLQLEFQQNNEELISDNIREIAKLFGVKPELLLSNLLVFQIPTQLEKSRFNIPLTGNLSYEKKIETRAINYMYLQTKRFLEDLLEKAKNSIREEINEELLKVIEKFQSDL